MRAIAADNRGRMGLDALEAELRKGDVGTVVVTLGTTAIGAVDPLHEILALREAIRLPGPRRCGLRRLLRLIPDGLDEPARRAYAAIDQADSIVIDPHKHGLQPYGCGCVLFRDPAVGRFYKHDSPYTYFTSKELHLGEISLECSRAGAAAVALWATQRLLPLVPGGEFARGWRMGAPPPLSSTAACVRHDASLSAARCRPSRARYCGLEGERRNPRTGSPQISARDFCCLRRAESAPGSCTIAAILVSACGQACSWKH